MEYEFRRATPADLDGILVVLGQARTFMARQGISQWQDSYPTADIIRADIQNGESYLMCAGGQVAATAMLQLRNEPDYDTLSEGAWLGDGPYAALHRVALAETARGSGLAGQFLARLQALCTAAGRPTIRVDTHPQNLPMQRFLQKNGFVHRGAIKLRHNLAHDQDRIVFEKL